MSGPELHRSADNHTSNSEPTLCHICLEFDAKNSLLKSCQCRRHYHYLCLTKSMEESGRDVCAKCGTEYSGIEYSKRRKGFKEFLVERQKMSLFWVGLRFVLRVNAICLLFAHLWHGFVYLLRFSTKETTHRSQTPLIFGKSNFKCHNVCELCSRFG